MKFTKSQRELIEISREPIKGFQLDIVEVHQDFSGISTALKFIKRQPWKNIDGVARNITLEAAKQWDVVMGLVDLAGRDNYGSGYLDTLWRSLSTLSGPEHRPLCIWLDDARHMKCHERETIVCLIEWLADQLDIPIRIVMLVGKVKVWNFHEQRRFSMFVHSARLDERARKFTFTRDGIDEVNQFEAEQGQGGELVRKVG